jgi:hypothetical protein
MIWKTASWLCATPGERNQKAFRILSFHLPPGILFESFYYVWHLWFICFSIRLEAVLRTQFLSSLYGAGHCMPCLPVTCWMDGEKKDRNTVLLPALQLMTFLFTRHLLSLASSPVCSSSKQQQNWLILWTLLDPFDDFLGEQAEAQTRNHL